MHVARRSRRICAWSGSTALVVAGALVAPAVAAEEPEVAPSAAVDCTAVVAGDATPATELQDAWWDFGDAAGHGEWAGADGTYSVPLPDGDVAWLYNDTFLGPTAPDRSVPGTMVHNSIVTAGPDGKPVDTVTGGTPEAPTSLVGPDGVDDPWYWNTDGIVDDGKLYVFEAQQDVAGEGHWGFDWIGTDIAVLSLDDYRVEEIVPTYDGAGITWGVELVPVDDYVYVYGMGSQAHPEKEVHVARAHSGELTGAWEFWDGSGWSADEADSAIVANNVGSSFGVAEVQGQYVLLTTDSYLGSGIYAHVSATPWGFAGTERQQVYDTPEGQPGYDADLEGDVYTYNVAVHPSISGDDELVLSYNTNNSNFGELTSDVSFNRARFLTLGFEPLPAGCGEEPQECTVAIGGPATTVADLQDAWFAWGDAAGEGDWTGGDGMFSVPLPDGDVAWFLNDTFVGPIGEDRSIPRQDPVHNTLVLSGPDGTPRDFVTNGTAEHRLPLVGPEGYDEPWYWNADGIVDDGKVYVFEAMQRYTGPGHWGFEGIGMDLATFSLPDLELESVAPTYYGEGISWGTELVRVDDQIYVYGTGSAGGEKAMFLARAQSGELDGAWEFWTGDAWSAEQSDAAALLGNVGSTFGVSEVAGKFVLVTTDAWLGSGIYAHVSDTPWGFGGTERVQVYDTPEGQPDYEETHGMAGDSYTYNVAAHPAISDEGELVFSYNTNSTELSDLLSDIDRNRSRYLSLPLEVDCGEPSGPELNVAADARCLGGTAYVAVRATNVEDAAVDVDVTTPFGARTFTDVAPGKNAYQSFNTRADELEAGSVTVTASQDRDGATTSKEYSASYDAISCG